MSDEITLQNTKRYLLNEMRTTTNHANVAQAYKILAESEGMEARTAIDNRNAEQQLEANKKHLALQFRERGQELNGKSPLAIGNA